MTRISRRRAGLMAALTPLLCTPTVLRRAYAQGAGQGAGQSAGQGAGQGAGQSASAPVRIGVLDDMSGILADQQGPGDVVGAQMAVDEFGGKVLGRPIEVLGGDHQNNPDIGLALVRRWYDTEGVQVTAGMGHSAIALAAQRLTQERNRVQLNTSAGTAELTGKSCSPNGVHWVFDTYADAKGAAEALVPNGRNRWFLISVDYAFGHMLEQDTSRLVKQLGGTVVGAVRHPAGTSDFSNYLLRANSSGANVVAIANSGGDTITAIKQAQEFGLAQKGQTVVALTFFLTNAHAVGTHNGQGLQFVDAFYWDQNDRARAFSRQFGARHRNRPPTSLQAGTYSAVRHYLHAVQDAGTLDGRKVVERMKAMPVNDVMTRDGRIREDGRLLRDMYLMEMKRPEEQKGEWDLLKIVATIPKDQAFRPLAEGGCPFVKA